MQAIFAAYQGGKSLIEVFRSWLDRQYGRGKFPLWQMGFHQISTTDMPGFDLLDYLQVLLMQPSPTCLADRAQFGAQCFDDIVATFHNDASSQMHTCQHLVTPYIMAGESLTRLAVVAGNVKLLV